MEYFRDRRELIPGACMGVTAYRVSLAALTAAGHLCLSAAPCAAALPGGVDERVRAFLADTLAGHFLYGYPYGGVTLKDIVLIAILAFLFLKLLSLFLRRPDPEAETGQPGAVVSGGRPDPWRTAREPGAVTGPVRRSASSSGYDRRDDPPLPSSVVFDKEAFLLGAKKLFTRLQESWDRRDVDDIASFSTPAIINEVRAQAEVDPAPAATQILLVNASLVSTERDGGEDVVTVFFDVLLREDPDKPQTAQIRELWHFVRPAGSGEMWKLDGIQQVD